MPLIAVAGDFRSDGSAGLAARRPAGFGPVLAAGFSERFFDAGQEVYQLVSPTGGVYIMQSASLAVDPGNTVDQLATLGERLKLPEGREYRTLTLEEGTVARAEGEAAPATIVLDENEDNYQRIVTA